MIKSLFIRRNILIALAILATLFVGFRVYSSYSKKPQYETIEVKKTAITQNVTASGEIKSEDEVELKFPVSGKLTYLAVKKNDRVKKWGYIGSLDKEELQKKITKALRDYSKERNDFDEDSQITYKDKVITDTIKRILEKNQWDLDKAVLDVEIADITKKNADLYSPIAGVITKVHTHEGTSVINTTPIVTIADPDKMVFLAKIGEADIAEIASGQEATVTLDAFEGKKFTGKVTEVDYAATTSTNGGGKSYQVKIALNDLDKVKLDMSGDVEIITVSHKDALGIPRVAVQEKNDKKYVEVLESNELKQKEVATGIKGTGGVIEVLSGLVEGEKVVIPMPNK